MNNPVKAFLTLVFLLIAAISFGQNFVYPVIKQKGISPTDFVPAGWKILDKAVGDLNNDKQADAVLILQNIDSVLLTNAEDDYEDSILTQPRILVILFKNTSDKLFHLAEQSNTFILTYDYPDFLDPYQSTSISNGILQINFYWYPTSGNNITDYSYKFRFTRNDFYLVGADYEEHNKAIYDFVTYSYNFLTQKRILSKGNWDKKTKKSRTTAIHINPLKTIKTLKQPYEWEVENGIYL